MFSTNEAMPAYCRCCILVAGLTDPPTSSTRNPAGIFRCSLHDAEAEHIHGNIQVSLAPIVPKGWRGGRSASKQPVPQLSPLPHTPAHGSPGCSDTSCAHPAEAAASTPAGSGGMSTCILLAPFLTSAAFQLCRASSPLYIYSVHVQISPKHCEFTACMLSEHSS